MRSKFLSAFIVATAFVAAPGLAQDASRGEQAFKKCRACHDAGPGAKNKVGPALTGVVGRKAASVDGFNYSEAFKAQAAAGLTWTEDKLSGYLEAPAQFIPKNKMAFVGVKDAGERADLIAYLKTQN